jgi:hypothetical protein
MSMLNIRFKKINCKIPILSIGAEEQKRMMGWKRRGDGADEDSHGRNWHMVMSAIAPRTGRIQVRSPELKFKGDRD